MVMSSQLSDVMVTSLHHHVGECHGYKQSHFLCNLFPPSASTSVSLSLLPFSIMSEQPQAVCGLAYDLVQRLSPVVRQIDFALDWMELEAGRALYKYV